MRNIIKYGIKKFSRERETWDFEALKWKSIWFIKVDISFQYDMANEFRLSVFCGVKCVYIYNSLDWITNIINPFKVCVKLIEFCLWLLPGVLTECTCMYIILEDFLQKIRNHAQCQHQSNKCLEHIHQMSTTDPYLKRHIYIMC